MSLCVHGYDVCEHVYDNSIRCIYSRGKLWYCSLVYLPALTFDYFFQLGIHFKNYLRFLKRKKREKKNEIILGFYPKTVKPTWVMDHCL